MAEQQTLKHYVAAFVFMMTWMGGPFVEPPSLPRANVTEISSTEPLFLPLPLSEQFSAPSKELNNKLAKFTQPQMPGHE
jgi:hypothetical protein